MVVMKWCIYEKQYLKLMSSFCFFWMLLYETSRVLFAYVILLCLECCSLVVVISLKSCFFCLKAYFKYAVENSFLWQVFILLKWTQIDFGWDCRQAFFFLAILKITSSVMGSLQNHKEGVALCLSWLFLALIRLW